MPSFRHISATFEDIPRVKRGTHAPHVVTNLDFVIPFAFEWNATVQYNFGGCSAFALSSAAQDENGYGNFEYAPPSGYYALCTKNLAEYG